jgi:hypothetical protein
VEIITTLTGEDGTAAFSSRESLDVANAASDAKNARIPVVRQIPLKDVRPGRYTLRVEARALGDGATPVIRETGLLVKTEL